MSRGDRNCGSTSPTSSPSSRRWSASSGRSCRAPSPTPRRVPALPRSRGHGSPRSSGPWDRPEPKLPNRIYDPFCTARYVGQGMGARRFAGSSSRCGTAPPRPRARWEMDRRSGWSCPTLFARTRTRAKRMAGSSRSRPRPPIDSYPPSGVSSCAPRSASAFAVGPIGRAARGRAVRRPGAAFLILAVYSRAKHASLRSLGTPKVEK